MSSRRKYTAEFKTQWVLLTLDRQLHDEKIIGLQRNHINHTKTKRDLC